MNVKPSRYRVSSPNIYDERRALSLRLVLSTTTTKVVVLPATVADCFEAGRVDQLGDSVTKLLIDAGLLVPVDRNELSDVIAENREITASTELLYECLQPSAACQLGCGYCGQTHTVKRMSEYAQNAVVSRIGDRLTRGRYRELHIGWFGAEPLTGMSVIRRLTPRLREAATQHGCGYTASMVTNGLSLTPDLGVELCKKHFVETFEVTLDGDRASHDLRRATKSGRPTFDRIFGNLVGCARRSDFTASLSIRCNVDARNANSVSPLIDLIAKSELRDRATFHTAPIHDWGNDAGKLSLSPSDYATAEINWLAQMVRLGMRAPLMPKRKPVVCMAVTRHAEIIDPFGTVFNCTELPLVPGIGVATDSTPVTLLRLQRTLKAPGDHEDFLDRVEQGEFGCGACPMLPVCGGACPKAWDEGKTPCPSAKLNMPERLALAYAGAQLRGLDEIG